MAYHKLLYFLFVCLVIAGCYSFSGSSLPAHIKSVCIPLCQNETLKPGIAEAIHESVSNEFIRTNLLRVVDKNGDSELNITVSEYKNEPYTFDINANVQQYKVDIVIETSFINVKNYKPIYQGKLHGIGIYDLASESEETGLQKAIKDITDAVVNNTVSGW
ncbi:MAG: LPS assembly lipoprotein LptE [bacterium]